MPHDADTPETWPQALTELSEQLDRVRSQYEARGLPLPQLPPELSDRLFSYAPIGFAYRNAAQNIQWVNPQYEDLFGPNPDAEAAALVNAQLERTLRQGLPTRVDAVPVIRSEHGGRRTVYMDFTNVPIIAAGGEVEGVLSVAVDVTARVENERRRESLLQDQARLEHLKTDFLTAMAHELRTPLSAVLGNAELLTEEGLGPLTPMQKELVANLEKGANELKSVVDRLLRIAHVEAGHMEAVFTDVELGTVLQEVVCCLEDRAETKGLTLTLDRGEVPQRVHGDPSLLGDVFRNLVQNAITFTSSGSITIRLTSVAEEAVITVEDTGVGIAPEVLPQLFERLYQRDPNQPGAGLGLALVKSLVEVHGGTIDVRSEEGRGSVVTVTLPLQSS